MAAGVSAVSKVGDHVRKSMNLQNPFEVTKAVDLTDREIMETWVDHPVGGFYALAKPTSPMPMLLLGGKGSGRTHLMRYFSFALQKLRARPGESALGAVQRDRYVGIYSRCEGLNAGRFDASGKAAAPFRAVFPYYMDLWVSQVLLGVLQELLLAPNADAEAAFCGDVIALFDKHDFGAPRTLAAVRSAFKGLQREIDIAINNASITRRLPTVEIVRATRGRLLIGIPQLAAQHFPELRDVLFLYLIDELENLTEWQQEYVNTVIREKQLPVSLKVGARLYGVRTHRTLSAGEENREGNEFEELYLDEQLRSDEDAFAQFACRLILRRLAQWDFVPKVDAEVPAAGDRRGKSTNADLRRRLEAYFEEIPRDEFEALILTPAYAKYPKGQRPHLVSLRRKLEDAFGRGGVSGLRSSEDIDRVLVAIANDDSPLVEKTSAFLLYQDWAAKRDLSSSAVELGESARRCLEGQDSRHRETLRYYRTDLIAQMLRDARQGQRYYGLDTFIHMADGLPRHLLMILKHVFKWAVFNGERPFAGVPVSLDAQLRGVLQASNWFFEDARTVGPKSQDAQGAVDRLATLLREVRYSDKPYEPSCIGFSFDESSVPGQTLDLIRYAEQTSMIVRVVGGQRERNALRVDAKYYLNPMLCPRYDLPVYRRGTMPLSSRDMVAIFTPVKQGDFEQFLRTRVARFNAPFPGSESYPVLPGL